MPPPKRRPPQVWHTIPGAAGPGIRGPARAQLPPAPRPAPPNPVMEQYNAELAALAQIEQLYRQQMEQQVAQQRTYYAQLAQQLAPIAGQVEGIVNRQTEATTGFARGFSDAMAQIANQSTGAAQADVAGFGMPTGNLTPVGEAVGNALYGEKGYVPATGFSNYGVAQAAAAAMLPGTARLQGEQQIGQMMSQFQSENLLPLQIERLKLAASLPQRRAEFRENRQELRDRRRAETLDLYKAGLLTQRQFARRMGVKNWRKFPNALPSEESSFEIRSVGNSLVAIDPRSGRTQVIYQGPEDPDVRTSGGYIWERDPRSGQWQPVGGTGPAPDKPSNYQTKTINGKAYIFDPNSGTFYDPRTGKSVVPRGTGGKPPSSTTLKNGWKIVRQGKKGWWALQANPDEVLSSNELRQILKDSNMTIGQLNSLPPEELDALGIAYYQGDPGEVYLDLIQSGVPARRAKRMVQSVWKDWGRTTPPHRLRDYSEGPGRGSGKDEPASGGRRKVSFSGSESLMPTAVPLMGYALSRGFTNLGTHNPASRLPGGGISDHAKYPAEAFDIGGFSGGYGNAKARRMFQWLIRQPGVKYVILGDKIWSRERGLHAYTSGGHDTHIHVSVYPGAEL